MTNAAHAVRPGEGETLDLGVVTMRILAAGDATKTAFTLSEFTGAEGPWTIPHVHNHFEESFFVLAGNFTFTVAGKKIEVGAGSYVLVPRGTSHVMSAGGGGGRLLVLAAPGGHEAMFRELAQLSPDSIRNLEVRAAISVRHDSTPAT